MVRFRLKVIAAVVLFLRLCHWAVIYLISLGLAIGSPPYGHHNNNNNNNNHNNNKPNQGKWWTSINWGGGVCESRGKGTRLLR